MCLLRESERLKLSITISTIVRIALLQKLLILTQLFLSIMISSREAATLTSQFSTEIQVMYSSFTISLTVRIATSPVACLAWSIDERSSNLLSRS